MQTRSVNPCLRACASFLPCRCYGSDMMAREDVAVVCALVLLLRLGRFPEPDGFGELRPLSCHVMSCHVMSCHGMSCHVMSRHVTSRHVTSRHVMSCHVMSCRVVMSHHVMPGHVMPYHIVSCRIASCYVAKSGHKILTQLPHSHYANARRSRSHSSCSYHSLSYSLHSHHSDLCARVALSTNHGFRFRLPAHVLYFSFRCGVIRSYISHFFFGDHAPQICLSGSCFIAL